MFSAFKFEKNYSWIFSFPCGGKVKVSSGLVKSSLTSFKGVLHNTPGIFGGFIFIFVSLYYLPHMPCVTGAGSFFTVRVLFQTAPACLSGPLGKDLHPGSAPNLSWALGKLLPVLLAPFCKQWQALSTLSERHCSNKHNHHQCHSWTKNKYES